MRSGAEVGGGVAVEAPRDEDAEPGSTLRWANTGRLGGGDTAEEGVGGSEGPGKIKTWGEPFVQLKQGTRNRCLL